MIAGLVIIGFFVVSTAALYVVGCHVENPAEREVSFADRLAIMSNDLIEVQRLMAGPMVEALKNVTASVVAFGEALAPMAGPWESAADAMLRVNAMWYAIDEAGLTE